MKFVKVHIKTKWWLFLPAHVAPVRSMSPSFFLSLYHDSRLQSVVYQLNLDDTIGKLWGHAATDASREAKPTCLYLCAVWQCPTHTREVEGMCVCPCSMEREPSLSYFQVEITVGGCQLRFRHLPPSTLFCAPRYMSTLGELASKSPRVSSWWSDPIQHCFSRPCPTGDPPCHSPSPPPLPTRVSTPLPQFALRLCQSSPPVPHHVLIPPSGLSLGPFLPEAFLGLLHWTGCPHKHTPVPTFSIVGVSVIYFCMLWLYGSCLLL